MKTYIFKTDDGVHQITLPEYMGNKKVEMLRNKYKMSINDSSQTVTITTPFATLADLKKQIEY